MRKSARILFNERKKETIEDEEKEIGKKSLVEELRIRRRQKNLCHAVEKVAQAAYIRR